MPGRFELYRDLRGRFRFHLKANDGTVILSSDGFEQKAAALDAVVSIMKSVQEASIVDLTGDDAWRYGDGDESEEPGEEASYGEEAYGYDEYAYDDEAYEAFSVGLRGAGLGKKGKRKKKKEKKQKKERKEKSKRARGDDRKGNRGGKGKSAKRKKKK